jgi:hypothetical protein
MTQNEIGTIRHLTLNELEIVSGGDSEEIVVTARREGARSYFYESLSGLGGGGGGFGFGLGYGGESGGGGGITIELDPIDSDGDGTPDENDEAPYDASNNTIVVTASAEQYRLAIDALVDATVEADLGFFIGFTAAAGAFLGAGSVTGGTAGVVNNAFDISMILPNVLAAHQEYINSRADSLYYDRLAGRHAQEQ